MRMILQYESGVRVEAILLAIEGQKMRVAVNCADDATIFVLSDGYWYGENGEIVEIEAAAFAEEAPAAFTIQAPVMMTAGAGGVSTIA